MKNKKEVISYLIFGVLTTLVNIVVYGLLTKLFSVDYRIATTIAWVLSVLFAFITNKLFVFESKSMALSSVMKELSSFILFRLVSYLLDLTIMIVMVEWLVLNDLFSKIVANVVVVIINYFASKLFIFKNAAK